MPKRWNEFDRKIEDKAWRGLSDLAHDQGDNWWKDLLAYWVPSGSKSGDAGLRLAVRKNSLNFYRKGQSVAKVGFDGRGMPFAHVHVKYASPNPSEKSKPYVRMSVGGLFGAETLLAYRPRETVRNWIERAAKKSGKEKPFIDSILDHNPTVIDLEMGLPAFEGQRLTTKGKPRAPRIDLVALEERDGKRQIVFWEAKLMSDQRLVAKELVPEVANQIADYKMYLSDDRRLSLVLESYVRNCKLLVKLRDLAKVVNPEIAPLGEAIVAVADGDPLTVDTSPRIVICDDGYETATLQRHLDRLRRGLGEPIPCLVVKGDGLLRPPDSLP